LNLLFSLRQGLFPTFFTVCYLFMF